jgi:hypothetical protein
MGSGSASCGSQRLSDSDMGGRIEMAVLGDVDGTYGSESTGGWLLSIRGVAIWQMAVLATRLVMAVDESEDPEHCPRTVVDSSLLGQKTRAKLEEGESRPLHQVTSSYSTPRLGLTYDCRRRGKIFCWEME